MKPCIVVADTKVEKKRFDTIFKVEHFCPEYGVSTVPPNVNNQLPDYTFSLPIRPYGILTYVKTLNINR